VLADFGFTRVTTISARASYEDQGTAAFMAPELLLSAKYGLEKGVPSKEADVYALGMTTYQVLTGQWPFFPRREAEVMLAVLTGDRPAKPENAEVIGMTDALWNLVEECWKEDRSKRPDISNILGRFCEITGERITTDSADMAGSRLNAGKRHSVQSQVTAATSCSSG
jgi:serine/threonine protein kinase